MGSTEGPEYTPDELTAFAEAEQLRKARIEAFKWMFAGVAIGAIIMSIVLDLLIKNSG